MGIWPLFKSATFSWFTSRQNTLLPASARQAPVTRPTYPVPITVTFMRIYSWGEIKFFRSAGRIRLPAAAGRALPVELARLEVAAFAAIAGEPARMAVHEVAHELQVAPPVGRARCDDLGFQQAVQAEQGRVAAQLVAHER